MRSVLRLALIDDEPPALLRLRLALANEPDAEIVATAADGAAALDLIRRGGIDVVLLDIRMPGLSGLDLARAIDRSQAPAFIFVTAFSHFAADAFELAAVDYLLKPFAFERLRQALERARRSLETRAADVRIAELEAAVATLRAQDVGPASPQFLKEIWAPDRGDRVRLPAELIDWIEAERDYVRIHSRGRSFLIRRTIGRLQADLDPAEFIRVHRSALVRRDCIARLTRTAGGPITLILQSGAEVPIARRQATLVRDQLGTPAAL